MEEKTVMPERTGEKDLRTLLEGLNVCCKCSDVNEEEKNKVNTLCMKFLKLSEEMDELEEQHNEIVINHRTLEEKYTKLQEERAKTIEELTKVLKYIQL